VTLKLELMDSSKASSQIAQGRASKFQGIRTGQQFS